MIDNAARLRTLAAGAVLGLVAVTTACTSSPAPPASTPTSAPTSASTSLAPPPLTDDAYQHTLHAMDTAMSTAFGGLAAAKTPQQVRAAEDAISAAVEPTLRTLGRLRPPPAAQAANTALIASLRGLPDDLDTVSTAAENNQVCVGGSATALLSRGARLAALRDAVTDLRAHYTVGGFVPPVAQDSQRFAATGTVVTGARGSGQGWLTITNGGSTDATVGLVRGGSGAPTVSVYIAHGATYTLKGIADGGYTIYVATGVDWDSGARLFTRNCQFQKFDDPLNFATTAGSATTYSITLTPVAGGTATESDVDPGAFPH